MTRTATPTTEANLIEKTMLDARRLAGSTHSPDDLFQEAMAFFLENQAELRRQAHTNPAAFIRTRLYFEIQHFLAGDRRQTKGSASLECMMDETGVDFVAEGDGRDPEDIVIERESLIERQALARRIRDEIKRLPGPQRRVVEMRIRGQRQHDIAHRLGVSPANITQILKRARLTLVSAVS